VGKGVVGGLFMSIRQGGLQNHIFQAVTNAFDMRRLSLVTKNT